MKVRKRRKAAKRKTTASKRARHFEPAVFAGTVVATTDEDVFIETVAGPLHIKRKNTPSATRYARGQVVEVQVAIVPMGYEIVAAPQPPRV
jgi:hypothetical protein